MALVLAAAVVATVAQADVKIVSHLNISMMGRAMPNQSVTTYYKGDMMRSDVKGLTTIFDAKTGKAYMLNNGNKTYGEMGDQMMPGTKIEATAKVTPSDEHKTIDGMNATKFDVNVHMTLTGKAGPQPMDMVLTVWTTSDVKSAFVPAHLVGMLSSFFKGTNLNSLQDFMAEMAKIKGFPLEQTMTMDTLPGMPAGAVSKGPMMTYDLSADSVSEDALDDSLFQIPSDYKKVEHVATGGPG